MTKPEPKLSEFDKKILRHIAAESDRITRWRASVGTQESLDYLEERGLIVRDEDGWTITPRGRAVAAVLNL